MKDISRIFLVVVFSALVAVFLSACGDSGGTSTIIGGTPGGGGTAEWGHRVVWHVEVEYCY